MINSYSLTIFAAGTAAAPTVIVMNKGSLNLTGQTFAVRLPGTPIVMNKGEITLSAKNFNPLTDFTKIQTMFMYF